MIAVTTRLQRPPRLGISLLEFTAYFAAMVGGICLGSVYLGANLKEMAYTALERVHVIEPRRAATDAPAIEAAAGQATEPGAAPTEVAATQPLVPATTPAPHAQPPAPATRTPSTAAAPQPAALPAEAVTATSPAAPAAEPAPPTGFFAREDLITEQQREALTRSYWEALAACMKDEVQHRVPAIDADGNWQLFDYLSGRKEGHQKAAAAIAALDQRGVDDHVLVYSNKARAWHEDGAKLFGRAVDLLTDAPTAQLSGPFAQSWQSASTQHRMEARLLAEKLQAVQSYLDHAYQPAGGPQAAAPQAAGQPRP